VSLSFPAALLAAALFLPQLAGGVYAGLGRPLPDAFPPLTELLFFVSMVGWFWSFTRAHRLPWMMDMGLFLWWAWIIVVPYYVLRHEGRRGLLRIGLFALTYAAALALGWATSIWTRLVFGTD